MGEATAVLDQRTVVPVTEGFPVTTVIPEPAKAGYFKMVIPKDVEIEALMRQMEFLLPVRPIHERFVGHDERIALFVVDVVNGFCTPGCGALAPPAPNQSIEEMIWLINILADRFNHGGHPIVVLRDCHDGHEPPYPDHCQRGSIEAELVPQLKWLEQVASLIIDKGCMNGWIGAEAPGPVGTCHYCESSFASNLFNPLREFIINKRIETAVVVGICTDICVMRLVQSLLDARNVGLIPPLRDVVVDVMACATYDLPIEVCHQLDLPEALAHPRQANQHFGLYQMQQSGAILTNNILF